MENVAQEELIQVAQELCSKNKMDVILANDLALLRKGDATRFPVTSRGHGGEKLQDAGAIFRYIHEKIGERNE